MCKQEETGVKEAGPLIETFKPYKKETQSAFSGSTGKVVGAANPPLTEEVRTDPGWQPIETAPRNTYLILAFGKHVLVGKWNWHRGYVNARPYWQSQSHYGISWDRENQPTHWMPLPSPPEGTVPKVGGH